MDLEACGMAGVAATAVALICLACRQKEGDQDKDHVAQIHMPVWYAACCVPLFFVGNIGSRVERGAVFCRTVRMDSRRRFLC